MCPAGVSSAPGGLPHGCSGFRPPQWVRTVRAGHQRTPASGSLSGQSQCGLEECLCSKVLCLALATPAACLLPIPAGFALKRSALQVLFGLSRGTVGGVATQIREGLEGLKMMSFVCIIYCINLGVCVYVCAHTHT